MPSRLSLRQRRLLARGINPRVQRAWASRSFLGLGNRATLNVGTGNAAQTYISKVPGTGGNAVTLRFVVAGNNTPLSVSVAGNAVTVNLATNGVGASTSTARDVRRAIQAHPGASALVHVQPAAGSDATGTAGALAATPLAGAS